MGIARIRAGRERRASCESGLSATIVAMLVGASVPHSVIGHRNAGCPTWEDVMWTDGTSPLPMHAAEIGAVDVQLLVDMARGTKHAFQMSQAAAFLRDPAVFRGTDVDYSDAACSLTEDQVSIMIERGFYELLDKDEAPKGVVRVFLIPEPWKSPPRQRVIHWTYSINALNERVKPPLELISQRHTRFLVHKGSFAISIDGKAAFNQFPNSKEVGLYQCITTPMGWAWLKRMAMGSRFACFVADVTLRVLSDGCQSEPVTYIDNLHMANDSEETLVDDVGLVGRRSIEARYTWNEDLSDPKKLIAHEVEFLGLRLDHLHKRVRLADKVLRKLATVWAREQEWTVRDFVVTVAILCYMTNAVGRKSGRWSPILRLWARAQGESQQDTRVLKCPFGWPNEQTRDVMTRWVLMSLENDWSDVPEQLTEEDDFLLITDASKHFWCGIIISLQSGQCTVMSGHWPEEVRNYVEHSAYAEPLAVAASINTFFFKDAKARIRHIGDNKGNQGVIHKGYSTKAHQVLMEYLDAVYPGLHITADYWEGASIPADEPSRGQPLDLSKLKKLAEHYKVTISEIRDLTAST
jgi:hypothetical protein